MPDYEYSAEVRGFTDGRVTAKNKQEAEEKIRDEIAMDGLVAVGRIDIERQPKDS